ncbi:MAG: DUF4190 domain-containing protein [Lachnospiraceae bacterium]
MDDNNYGPEWRNNEPAQWGGQTPYPPQYPPSGSQVVLREVGRQKENRLAIAALVLGIVTLLFFWAPFISLFTGIIGMVLAVISLVKEDQKAMPIIGMVLSILGLALTSLMILGFIVEYLTHF